MGKSEKPAKGAPSGLRAPSVSAGQNPGAQQPEWADGLRKLYDSVVEEPLPDSFKDLLAQLDESPDEETD